MILDKCDAFTAKETPWCRERKTYVAAARELAKREENQRGMNGETNP